MSVSFELSSPLYTGRHLPGSDFISKNKHDSVVNVMNQEIGQVKLIGEKAELEKKSQVELVSQLQESLRIANNYAVIYQREKEDRDRNIALLERQIPCPFMDGGSCLAGDWLSVRGSPARLLLKVWQSQGHEPKGV